MDEVRVFAPASVGNVGPGFDVLGMALSGMGDTLTIKRSEQPGIVINNITGDAGKLPADPTENTAGIAVQAVLDHLQSKAGLILDLHKEIPGSGLGSSAASAVAGAYAANLLFGSPLSKTELLPMAAVAESKVSGALFFDNIGPSMMGGVTWSHPETKAVFPLGAIEQGIIIVATPDFPILTKESRRLLPKSVPMGDFISNMAYTSMIAWAVAKNDIIRFGQSIQDRVAEPARSALIKGFAAVKAAALSAGALGCSISGAGATVFAVSDDKKQGGVIAKAMLEAFARNEVKAQVRVTTMDSEGARVIKN